MNKKLALYLGMLLVAATSVLAYHNTGAQLPSDGTPLPGWAFLLILAGLALLIYLAWRWWQNLK